MGLGIGWGAIIGVGHESTWGTPVARTKFIEQVSVKGGNKSALLQADTIRGRSQVNLFRGANMVEGEIVSELRYEGWEDFYLHLFGKVATTTTNSTGKQHIFSFDDTVAMPTGLTIEVKYDSAGTVLWEGCKVDQMDLAFEIDKLLKATIKVVGEFESTTTASTPTFPTAGIITWTQATLTKDAVAKEVVSCNVSVKNGYMTDRRVIGSSNVKEHTPGKRELTGQLTAWFENLTDWRDALAADSTFALVLTATGGTIAGSSPSDNYDLILNIPNVKIESHEKDVSDPGPMKQTVSWRAMKVSSTEVATLTITNLRSSVP